MDSSTGVAPSPFSRGIAQNAFTPRAAGSPLRRRYLAVREATVALLDGLTEEDAQVQSMPDASPTKWHLGHTTWFFEKFVLSRVPGYSAFNEAYDHLFDFDYETLGTRVERGSRGLLTRPSLQQILEYRRYVDERLNELLARDPTQELLQRVELGIHHEQQHQELVLMDVKHLFGHQPLLPAYRSSWASGARLVPRDQDCVGQVEDTIDRLSFGRHPEGVRQIGHAGDDFCFDNERPRHHALFPPFEIAQRLTTNGEYLEFIQDGGYERAELWLSDGFRWKTDHSITLPLYWHGTRENGRWTELQAFTLRGMQPLALDEPVCHVSYYEADAFARWSGARLPTESQWECAANSVPVSGNFLESQRLHPAPARGGTQWFGDVWEWTESAYAPYPGYRPGRGALGEYNGKFMCNQMVLRGGSCVTPREHVRPTYRNFFPPHCRWQFSGIRLARDT